MENNYHSTRQRYWEQMYKSNLIACYFTNKDGRLTYCFRKQKHIDKDGKIIILIYANGQKVIGEKIFNIYEGN